MSSHIASLEEQEDTSILRWFSHWGMASVFMASISLFQAYIVGMQSLTVILSFIGLVVTYLGFRSTRGERRPADWVWLSVGGVLNCTVGILTLVAPGSLNKWWALNEEVILSDIDERIAVPRDHSSDAGRQLKPDEWADAATEAIRQHQIFIRIESAKVGSSAGTGSGLLIHLRLLNMGHGDAINFQGFSGGGHEPVLKDDSGQSYPLQEHKVRKASRGAPVFESFTAGQVELPMSTPLDQLLVFAYPAAQIKALNLEIPSSAWGMKGMCKFRIDGSMDSFLTDKKSVIPDKKK
jgi:hypothetical protein